MKRGGSGRLGWSAAGLALAFGIVVLVNVLASSRTMRVDVTSTGHLALSPRTERVLASVSAGTEVVLAADLSSRSRSAAEVRRVLDMLDEIERGGPGLSVSVIDTSSGSGLAAFEALVRRLAARDADGIAASEKAVADAVERLSAAGERLGGFAADLESLRGRVDLGTANELGARASQLRTTAEQIGPMTAYVEELLGRELAGERLPDLPAARRVVVESADAVRTLLRVTANQMTAVGSGVGLDEETRSRVAVLERGLAASADGVGSLAAGLQARALPGVVRVVGALTASEALLVLGPGGVSAVSMDDLFPPSAPGAARNDPGRRAETLICNALATLDPVGRPMVVIAHAGTSRVLSEGGPLSSLRKRSALRGVEWVEWPVAMETDRPGAVAAALADERAVIYVVIGIDSSAGGGAERASRSAAVLEDLLASGERVMVNLAPSTLPGLGEEDPAAAALASLGLVADTGRPVLGEVRRGEDRLVAWEHVVVGGDGGGLAESVSGLAVAVPWPIVIDAAEEAEGLSPLLSLGAAGGLWREGEWLGYWVTPAQQRPLLFEKPTPGGTRDASSDAGVVAWQVERAAGRVMVMGSHLWMFDSIADRPAVIDGRIVQQNPGNAELFLAGIEWLAGNDELLGRSAAAFETPIVQPIDGGRLSLLRWILVGGLPVAVLLVGIAVRVVGG